MTPEDDLKWLKSQLPELDDIQNPDYRVVGWPLDHQAKLFAALIQLAAEQDARIAALEWARSRDDGDEI